MSSATVAERMFSLDLIVFGPIIHHIKSFYAQKMRYAIIPAFAGVARQGTSLRGGSGPPGPAGFASTATGLAVPVLETGKGGGKAGAPAAVEGGRRMVARVPH